MDEATRADMAAFTGCIAGALTEDEFRSGLEAAGFVGYRNPRDPSRARARDLGHHPRPQARRRLRAARRVELYEPAMCCQTGVCGPSVDQQLIDVREDLRWAESQGAAGEPATTSPPTPTRSSPTRRSPA